MSFCKTETEEHLEYNQLLEEFKSGCKTDEKIGLEYEVLIAGMLITGVILEFVNY